jgi:5-methylcytosine-specific restriction enzyme A
MMPVNPPVFRPVAQQSRQAQKRDFDRFRRRDKPWRKWYNLRLWRDIRAVQLVRQPLCERCKAEGLIVAATIVNHHPPHRGDWQRFVSGPFESLCKHCHDSVVQAEERGQRGMGRAGKKSPACSAETGGLGDF